MNEGKIWASHPNSFNDPFDFSIQMWNLYSFPEDYIKKWLNEFGVRNIPEDLLTLRKLFFQIFLKFIGVYCLNDSKNSDLFWGYYNEHKGFSIVFKTEKLNSFWSFSPLKIEYQSVNDFKKLDLVPEEVSDYKIFTRVLRWATLKKRDWIHENEWRYIFMDVNGANTSREKEFPSDAIKEIILGYKFFSNADYKYPDKNTTVYTFKGDLDLYYSFKILKWLLKNNHIIVKRVKLKEDFALINQRISISDISDNQVTITHFNE